MGSGIEDALSLKKHPWFTGIDFDKLSKLTPPFQPKLKDDLDTCYFDEVDESHIESMFKSEDDGKSESGEGGHRDEDGEEGDLDPQVLEMRKRLAFVGFTYKSFTRKTNKSILPLPTSSSFPAATSPFNSTSG